MSGSSVERMFLLEASNMALRRQLDEANQQLVAAHQESAQLRDEIGRMHSIISSLTASSSQPLRVTSTDDSRQTSDRDFSIVDLTTATPVASASCTASSQVRDASATRSLDDRLDVMLPFVTQRQQIATNTFTSIPGHYTLTPARHPAKTTTRRPTGRPGRIVASDTIAARHPFQAALNAPDNDADQVNGRGRQQRTTGPGGNVAEVAAASIPTTTASATTTRQGNASSIQRQPSNRADILVRRCIACGVQVSSLNEERHFQCHTPSYTGTKTIMAQPSATVLTAAAKQLLPRLRTLRAWKETNNVWLDRVSLGRRN